MFLSDKLEEIYSNSGVFDLDTCNAILRAIKETVVAEMNSFAKVAKERGSIKSSVLRACVGRTRTVWERFCEKHQKVPETLKEIVEINLQSYIDIIASHEH